MKFFTVLDPTKTSSYISEVLDAGLLGPLFKVSFHKTCLGIIFFAIELNSIVYYTQINEH